MFLYVFYRWLEFYDFRYKKSFIFQCFTITHPFGHSTTLDVTVVVNALSGLPTELILTIGAGGASVLLVIDVIVYKRKGT